MCSVLSFLVVAVVVVLVVVVAAAVVLVLLWSLLLLLVLLLLLFVVCLLSRLIDYILELWAWLCCALSIVCACLCSYVKLFV